MGRQSTTLLSASDRVAMGTECWMERSFPSCLPVDVGERRRGSSAAPDRRSVSEQLQH
ncbi:hypothetical protein FRIGORI9N_70068 [Frigoribacterium sp. 9N]|nr:hypothetical protein FRIGORI9N_70068 [Frigoribacterium sp. 9N]